LTQDSDPGVPEALPRVLRLVGDRLDPVRIQRIWIFPPLVRGRREWGLVAASTRLGGTGEKVGEGDVQRRLHTASYAAERTGKGLYLDVSLEAQGEAPSDRLPRVMEGVVRRSGDELGDPREVAIDGAPDRFRELMDDFDPSLFEESAEPLSASQT
jgi:hypothetical protein